MAKHHPDLIMCRKQPGIAIGRLCEKCDGKCVICDSYRGRFLPTMDLKNAREMLKHLEQQHELLVDARQSMLDELHMYQIEEEMLMRKLHEVMSAHDKRKEGYQHASADAESR